MKKAHGPCADCGATIRTKTGSGGTGYARLLNGDKICYDCAAVREERHMRSTGKATLYLVKRADGWHVTDWAGHLDYYASVTVHKHGHFSPLAGYMERIDAWFIGPDGDHWHGVHKGHNNTVLHCKRLKHKIDGLASTLAASKARHTMLERNYS